jgi:hypothetical protein
MRRGISALFKRTMMEDATVENAKSERGDPTSAVAIDLNPP